MKHSRFITFIAVALISLTGCEKFFLEKPDTTGTVDINTIFSSEKNATALLMNTYRNVLLMDWPGGIGISHSTLGSISGEVGRGYDWHGSFIISNQGLSVNGCDGSENGAERYSANWRFIRACYILIENIDMVPDMDDTMKKYVKAEAKCLIAYRYMGMFYRYGGVPLVYKSYTSSDDMTTGRSSVQEVLDLIVRLCDEAYADLPDSWDAVNLGRLTKGVALAVKARALQYAARPLFNSATPYLDNGAANNLICFGNYDKERWKQAIDANLAVIEWANANGYQLLNTGGAGEGVPNPNAFDDYATATSVAGNPEVLLPYKCDEYTQGIHTYMLFTMFVPDSHWDTDDDGVLTNMLENYYAADGQDLDIPAVGEAARPGSDWVELIENIEPRAKADIKFCGFDSYNNPGDQNWQEVGWIRESGNMAIDRADAWPGSLDQSAGCGAPVKFWYKAGTRTWFELPLFRMSEFYLNLAEAYNEYDDSQNALKYLNYVHNRAGLPSITESGQTALRETIQREFYIEFFFEGGKRYYNSKHWKRDDIDDGICGGQMRELQFSFRAGTQAPNTKDKIEWYWNANTFRSTWHPRMFLEPFPQYEINKGYIVQNPGY